MIKILALLCLMMTQASLAATLLEALEDPRISRNVRLPQGRPSMENGLPAEVVSLGRRLMPQLNRIRQSRQVYSWDVASPRDRMPNYCIDQCACLAHELLAAARASNYPVRKLTVRGAPREDMEVSIWAHDGQKRSYNYHQVLVIKIAGRWRVIDPLILGNTMPERLSAWLSRIDRRHSKVADVF